MDYFAKFGIYVLYVIITGIFGLLLAFPVMWCWNYAVVYVWHLPVITWGHAWCLLWVANVLIKSVHIDPKVKE